jgi:hypothetical protein
VATDTLLGWIGGIIVGLGFLLLGGSIGYSTARRWRPALLHFVGFVASLLAGFVAMPMLAVALVANKYSGAPEERARVLAECIAEAMNCGAWLALPALVLGFWVFRSRALKKAN